MASMQLQPKNGTRDTTVKDVAGNMHGLVHLLLCGAHVMHDDDFEEHEGQEQEEQKQRHERAALWTRSSLDRGIGSG